LEIENVAGDLHIPFNELSGVFMASIGSYENNEPIFAHWLSAGSSDMVRFDFGVFGKDALRS